MAVEFDHVSRQFDGVTALDNVTFSVPNGSIVGVVGTSGAGKSTLLRTVNGLEKPTGGTVTTLGVDPATLDHKGLRDLRREVGMIFQQHNLLGSKTVAENVGMPLTLAGIRDRRRVTDALELVGLNHRADAKPAQLSGGQRQRVWMAMVLAQDTPVLLLDEPTTYLDPARAMEILSIAKRQAQAGKVVISVLHDLHLAGHFSDRVVLLKEGHVYADGSPADVMTVDALKDVYDLRAEVWDDPASASPIIVPRGVYGHDQ